MTDRRLEPDDHLVETTIERQQLVRGLVIALAGAFENQRHVAHGHEHGNVSLISTAQSLRTYQSSLKCAFLEAFPRW